MEEEEEEEEEERAAGSQIVIKSKVSVAMMKEKHYGMRRVKTTSCSRQRI